MLGPALLEFGNEEQKLEYLPKIVRGEIRWCQGYSEPGSGSDLAGLRTKAEDRGDHYLVNGSKIWTSYADEADWIFCLVRTNFDVPKHEGISFLLFDMAVARRQHAADLIDQRLIAVLSDVLRQRQSAEASARRHRQSRLDDRQTPAAARTADDRRHRRQLGARRDRPQDGRHREGVRRRGQTDASPMRRSAAKSPATG